MNIISINKAELVEANGYGAIYANDEAANILYIVRFTSLPYTIQEYMESDGNKLASGDLVCNTIYKYTEWHKSRFNAEPCKKQKNETVSMKKVSITDIDVKFWTRKSELPQGNFLRSIPQSEITRQRDFELTDIEYDCIMNEI